MLERCSAGRVARAERHAYRHVDSQLRVRRGGRLIYADGVVLEPDDATGPAVFDTHAYVASAVRVGGAATDDWCSRSEHGVELVRDDSGKADVARALADDGVALLHALRRGWLSRRAADGLVSLALERNGS